MSMSLYVWKSPVLDDTDEAKRLVELEDESVFEPSRDLVRYFEELLERFPRPEALTEEELEQGATPWADSPEGSDRLVWLSIRWGADEDDFGAIYELARKYDLVVCDPQGPAVYTGADDVGAPYSPGLEEFVRCAILIAVGLLIGVIGWKLSILVVTWVLLFVGGFVTLVAVWLFVALAHHAWRASRSTTS